MKKERQYKEPTYKVGPKTGKILLYVLFLLRIILFAACVWGLYLLFG